ncbi:MAG: hypothetical protein M1823_002491 [Watsoniomyces obsoletus]|nr:MAG: hypothetical protein M1823_002491 [Watsoniomyces obsoletus]
MQAPPRPQSAVDNQSSFRSGQTARSASPYDPAVREIYCEYMVFIDRHDPPPDLLSEAKRILKNPRTDNEELSTELVAGVICNSRLEQDGSEAEVIASVFGDLIPQLRHTSRNVSSEDLSSSRDTPWTTSVPLADTIDSAMAPSLSMPKPDVLFGLSRDQLTSPQRAALRSFTREDGASYVTPDRHVHLPFLSFDFKAQAKRNTRYIANNQAAVAGAIINQGFQELSVRGGGSRDLSEDHRPRFFSVTADHELATVNLHWVGTKEGHSTYNMETLSWHLLRKEEGVRSLHRAVQNLLDYGRTTHLAWVRGLLDVCATKLLESGRPPLHPSKRRRSYRGGGGGSQSFSQSSQDGL